MSEHHRGLSRAIIALCACALAGCSSFTESPDAGVDFGPLTSCTGTAARAHQPLGKASGNSSTSGLAPLAAEGVAAVWEEINGTNDAVYFATIDTLGKVANAKQLAQGRDPVLLRLPDGLRLLWRQGSALMMQRLDDDGTAPAGPVTVHSPITSSFAATWTGQTLGVALNGIKAAGDEVHLMLVDADGKVQAKPVKVPQQGINSTLASIAWTGATFALAWTDMRAPLPAVYFALLDGQGKRLNEDLQLSEPNIRGSFPSVAPQYTGGIVVCYQQKMSNNIQDVFCSRLDAAGKPTQRTRVTQSAYDSQNPHAVAHGKHTWVLWDDVYDIITGTAIHWQFLDETGATVLNEPKVISDLMGWRPFGISRPEALYFVKYRQDVSNGWLAESAALNCF